MGLIDEELRRISVSWNCGDIEALTYWLSEDPHLLISYIIATGEPTELEVHLLSLAQALFVSGGVIRVSHGRGPAEVGGQLLLEADFLLAVEGAVGIFHEMAPLFFGLRFLLSGQKLVRRILSWVE